MSGEYFEHDEELHDERPAGARAALRIPPQSIEAEQAVLGGLMLVPQAWSDCAELISDRSFYRRDHALIWQAMATLHEKGQAFDPVTVGEWFERNGQSEMVAGGAYLIELSTTTPSAANIRAYAEIVADKQRLRKLADLGTQLADSAFNPGGLDTVEIIGHAQTRLGDLMQSEPCELESASPVLARVFDNLQRRYELNGALDGLSTGLRELDRVLNGLKGGRLYVIAARPKMGKSTLAAVIAEAVAVDQGGDVAFFSFEMPSEELMERMVCSVGNIHHDNLRRGQLEDEDWTGVTAAIRRLRGAPLYVSKPKNARVESLCAQVRRRHAKKPLKLIVIDYLQLMETKGAETRTLGMSEISRQLKLLAGELDVPIIALSQLNRDLEKRPNKRPQPSDLRDSGAIEQDADAVIFIYRDEVYNPGSPDKGTTEIDVALQRNGPSEMVRVRTSLHVCRFDNLGDDWSRPAPEEQESRAPRRWRKGGGADRAASGADS